MRNTTCPICSVNCISPSGHSDLLIILDAPTPTDVKSGRLFSTSSMFTTPGLVFRKELAQRGLDLTQFRVASLWQHEPNKKEECFKHGYDAVLEEAKGKKFILLVGADVVETFTGYKVSDVSGLQVDSPVLSAPIIYAMVNPSMALARSVGEVRLAVGKVADRLEKEGLVK
jgi:hypothetical protein